MGIINIINDRDNIIMHQEYSILPSPLYPPLLLRKPLLPARREKQQHERKRLTCIVCIFSNDRNHKHPTTTIDPPKPSTSLPQSRFLWPPDSEEGIPVQSSQYPRLLWRHASYAHNTMSPVHSIIEKHARQQKQTTAYYVRDNSYSRLLDV